MGHPPFFSQSFLHIAFGQSSLTRVLWHSGQAQIFFVFSPAATGSFPSLFSSSFPFPFPFPGPFTRPFPAPFARPTTPFDFALPEAFGMFTR